MTRASPEIGNTRHVVVKSLRVLAGTVSCFEAMSGAAWLGTFMGPLSCFLQFVVLMSRRHLFRCVFPRSGEARFPPGMVPCRAAPAARLRRAYAADFRPPG